MFSCVIIGAGCSGIALAYQLMGKAQLLPDSSSMRIILIEKEEFGAGAAYSTTNPYYSLNIPAQLMSLLPEDPSHFLRWAQAKIPDVVPMTYAPRMLYKEYLQDLMQKADLKQSKKCSLKKIKACIVSLKKEKERFSLLLENGTTIQADSVVLAMGNQPPSNLPIIGQHLSKHPNYIQNPWNTSFSIPRHANIFLLGTGLTMVDQVISLQAQGHQGKIHALSRHGQLPRSQPKKLFLQQPNSSSFLKTDFPQDWKALSWLRYFRHKFDTVKGLSLNEDDILHDERVFLILNEKRFPEVEIQRAIRHLKHLISAFAHQMPSDTGDELKKLIQCKKLLVHSGKIKGINAGEKEIEIFFKERFLGKQEKLTVNYVINCLGPKTTFKQTEDPFILFLYREGYIRSSRYNLILERSPSFNVIDKNGLEVEGLFSIGALNKTPFDTASSVPKISLEAYNLADTLIRKRLLEKSSLWWNPLGRVT